MLLFRKSAIIGFFTIISLVGVAQELESSLPLEPKFKVGVLPNGLTYYIRHNELPKQRAEFYIVQKVGSILEEENQRGLAHFLEHMAFNGTRSFQGNTLIKYLESIGVKFGENLNAYTSIDETVYNISNVPVTRQAIIDSSLLILHDWSSFISLDDSEIDKERGVIREEWRTTNNGESRQQDIIFKEAFPNNITGQRLPIGSIDVINNFSHQQLRDYYKKWYRPDLQAIIIVGDVDVNDIESRIKSLFADIPKPVNPAVRHYVPVDDNHDPIVIVATDPEVTSSGVSLRFKRNAVPFTNRNTPSYVVEGAVEYLIAQMVNYRLYEISRTDTTPFEGAQARYENYMISITKDAWATKAEVKEGGALRALKAIVRENERMRRFGFNASEFERVKATLLRAYQSQFNERENIKNEDFVSGCISHFCTNESMPGIEVLYNLVSKTIPSITVDQVNRLAQSFVTDTNIVVVVTSPRKEGLSLPSKAEILSAINEVKNENLLPYKDEVVNRPLLGSKPKAGSVVKTQSAPFGYTKWVLSNGVNVYHRKTDFQKDMVSMSAFSEGGYSLFDAKDRPNTYVINEVAHLGGIGDFSPLELGKLLSGKLASASSMIGETNQMLYGGFAPSDIKPFMEMTYLLFSKPRKDSVAFANFVEEKRNALANEGLDPMTAFSDTLRATIYNHNPLARRFDRSMLDKVDYERILNLYTQRFASAGGFSFVFTGNFDVDTLKSYVENYLGALPSTGKPEKSRDLGLRMVKGEHRVEFNRSLDVPKSTIFVQYSGKAKYSLENMILMEYLSSILDFRYTEAIREREGGTYGVSVNGSVSNKPVEEFALQVSFDTDPKLKDKLIGIVRDEIRNIAINGPSLVDVNKVKEFMLKKNKELLTENSYWESAMYQYIQDKIDLVTSYDKLVQSVTPEMVKKIAKQWLNQGNVVEVIMNPANK